MRSSKLLAALDSRAGSSLACPVGARWSRAARFDAGQSFLKLRNSSTLASPKLLRSDTLGLRSASQAASLSNNRYQHDVSSTTVLSQLRLFSSSRNVNATQQQSTPAPTKTEPAKTEDLKKTDDPTKDEDGEQGFEISERGAQAAQINLSAKLGRDAKEQGKKPAFSEIWRLLRIARPEAKSLALAFFFLLLSSGITMSVPFSIGRIMDIATKGESTNDLFGLTMPMFYGALAGILCLGAAANYGRIIILRIVGERVVARQRSKLFRRTFIQDAEFFDANRVGDLISRLSSDTLIVGKAITQNLSDGLRAAVSGTAGFAAMTYVSFKLSSVLFVLLPPIGMAAFFYGRAIRNLSRKIQKNLGTLTKIAEERLGNVKTSQSFAAEVSEVHRYNKQVRTIFDLGKKESLISATFFSTVRT
jgi:putative ABC transport system ATP-binding protein